MPLRYTSCQLERETIITANFDTKTLHILHKHYLCVDQTVWDLWWTSGTEADYTPSTSVLPCHYYYAIIYHRRYKACF